MSAPLTGSYVEVGDLSNRAFERLRAIVRRESGIVLGDCKRHLVRCRLQPRLRMLGLTSYDDYANLLENGDPDDKELAELLDRISTNQTQFFRERVHIDHLADEYLPEVMNQESPRTLRGWCAASSTGQEASSILMAMLSRLPAGQSWDVRILGTDISYRALQKARAGKYPEAELTGISAEHRRRFTKPVPGGARMTDEVLGRVEYARLNLLRKSYPLRQDLDFVFCRNVMIYFDAPTRSALVRRLTGHLRPRGLLALGVAEALVERVPGLQQVATSLYRKVP